MKIPVLLFALIATFHQTAQAQTARVSGIVIDSLHNEPLADARISIGGTVLATTTDAGGHFAFDAIPAGTYDIIARHAVADSLGLSLSANHVVIAPGGDAKILMAIPGTDQLRRIFCGENGTGLPGIIRGRVSKEHSNDGIPGAKVMLSWLSVGVSGDMKGALSSEGAVTATDQNGYYTFCGLPPDFEATAQAMTSTDTTGAIAVSLAWSPEGVLVRPFLLPSRQHGTSNLTGRVTGEDGRPVSGVSIDIPGHATSVKSKADGTFSLIAPAGTQTVRARKLGRPAAMIVEDLAEPSTSLEIKLGAPVPRLATVVVRGMMSDVSDRTGFSRRALLGPGKYVTAEQLEKSGARCVLDGMRHALVYVTKGLGCSVKMVSNQHFRGLASLQGLLPSPPAGEAVKMPVGSVSASGCMLVYVDDILEPTTSQADGDVVDLNWLDPAEVVGIEFYSAASAPGRFSQSRCNLILIWTLLYRGSHH
jgi:hypothetical protein